MKTIGMIGGMSWESTALYYQIINRTVQEHLGGLHSAKIVLHSFDFHEIEQLQHKGDWHTCGKELARVAASLEAAGADLLVLCTNTMHLVAPAIESAATIPLLHIADPTALRIKHSGLSRVGLLGTRFTMEQAFYRDRMTDKHGIEVITPGKEARDTVHRIIYDELCKGKILPESRAAYRSIMADLADEGAQGIILGCTEITMLVDASDSEVPLFDTTAIHAQEAALESCRSDT